MNFEPSEDQEALRDAIRVLCAGKFPLETIRIAESSGGELDPSIWPALDEAGVFALLVSETAGGLGLGLVDAALVLEELGRALVPGPIVASVLLACVVSSSVSVELLGALEGATPHGSIRRPARSAGEGTPAAGEGEEGPVLVEHLGSIAGLVVIDDARESLSMLDPAVLLSQPGTRRLGRPLDPLTQMWEVRWLPEGRSFGTAETYLWWRWSEAVLIGALCVGIATAVTEMAVEYAKVRRQFGQPIGAFQAIKHLCADMLVRVETARAAVHGAACSADQAGTGDLARSAAGAALLAIDAALANARSCIQVHGGMGFTWEVPAHLFLMRARVLASSLGSLDSLALTVADRY